MGVQPRSFAVSDTQQAKSPSKQTVISPMSRKRRFMDVVLVHDADHQDDTDEEERKLTQRVSFKRSKSGESELRVQVHTHQRDSESFEPLTPTSTSSSPDTTSPSNKTPARPNMSASQTITLDMLRPHFEKPLAQVAQIFGICVTLLKKICRKNGLARWPHRQIIGLRKSIASMEQAIDHFEGSRRDSYAQQLDKQRNKLTALLEDPTSCNLLAADDEYPSPVQPLDEPVRTAAMPSVPSQSPYYAAYAPPAPAYERAPVQYADYYHHAPPPPPAPHHAAYGVPHHHHNHYYPPTASYSYAPYHPAVHHVAQPPVLPPLRMDTRPALPSLSAALMGRRW